MTSVAANYVCGKCGGHVCHHDTPSDEETKLKCTECGTIGTIHHGLIRRKLDGLRRI